MEFIKLILIAVSFLFLLILFLVNRWKEHKLDTLKKIYSPMAGATDLQGVVMGCREFITEMGCEVLDFYYLHDAGLCSDLQGKISLLEKSALKQALSQHRPEKLKGSSEMDKKLMKEFGPDTWFIPLDMNQDDKSYEPLLY